MELIIHIFESVDGGHVYNFHETEDDLANSNDFDGGKCTSGKAANALDMAFDHAKKMLEQDQESKSPKFPDGEPELNEDPENCGCEKCGEVSRHCPDCEGGGLAGDGKCPTCDGVGSIPRDDHASCTEKWCYASDDDFNEKCPSLKRA